MRLAEYVAQKKRALYDDLLAGRDPGEGAYDPAALKEGRSKGKPQMGSTFFEPRSIRLEFIFPDPTASAVILTVTLDPPERVVYLPVPGWVVESIWQGEVSGSHHFESHARALVDEFVALTAPVPNEALFGPQAAKRRE